MFFSFDGVDGSGKSTQLELFCDWLCDAGHEVVTCRDPGSTRLGEAIRDVLLTRSEMPMHRRSEMLLYMAARAQMVEQLIRPALDAGKTVLSDRYLLANIVYQGHAGGLDVETVRHVGRVATDRLEPDLTIVLDMDVDQSTRRIQREHDRMEAQGREFLERVRQGFLKEAAAQPERIAVVDATGSIKEVQQRIRAVASTALARLAAGS